MKIGSLFSGIGGLELGLEWAGFGPTVWQVEQNEYCLKVLEKHWPNVKRFEDVQTVTHKELEKVDLICGGFPCQDVSSAGNGAGLKGARSGLWAEFYRVVHELEPEWVIVENVASGANRWVDTVRGGLELIGYETFPVPLSAADCGAPHLRRRVFIVGRAVETWSKRKWRSGGAYTVPHTQRESIRDEQGRRSGAHGERKTEFGYDGAAGIVAHADGKPKIGSSESREECNPWAVEPSVGRVADGIPDRVDRLRALGNAVVPQCAQVVGEFIKILKGGCINATTKTRKRRI
jgi:DNA (cytosine-5)-methyltransferase 1